jgi:hypothetical protein
MKTKLLCAALMCTLVPLARGARADLLTNGGLESSFGPSDYVYLQNGDTSIPSWTITYDGIGEQSYWWHTGHISNGTYVRSVAEGLLAISLNNGDSMTTAFNTVPGQVYDLQLFAFTPWSTTAQVQVGDLNQTLSLAQGTLTDLHVDNIGGLWSFFDLNFTAVSPVSTLALAIQEQGLQVGGWEFDGISVTATVPEPSCFALLGCAGTMLFRRRRQRLILVAKNRLNSRNPAVSC